MKPLIQSFFSQNLASAALSHEFTVDRDCRLLKVTLKASVGITETIQVTHVDGTSSNYNVLLDESSLSNEQNYVFRPDGFDAFKTGDKVKVTCTNAGTTGIVYGKIIMEDLL